MNKRVTLDVKVSPAGQVHMNRSTRRYMTTAAENMSRSLGRQVTPVIAALAHMMTPSDQPPHRETLLKNAEWLCKYQAMERPLSYDQIEEVRRTGTLPSLPIVTVTVEHKQGEQKTIRFDEFEYRFAYPLVGILQKRLKYPVEFNDVIFCLGLMLEVGSYDLGPQFWEDEQMITHLTGVMSDVIQRLGSVPRMNVRMADK